MVVHYIKKTGKRICRHARRAHNSISDKLEDIDSFLIENSTIYRTADKLYKFFGKVVSRVINEQQLDIVATSLVNYEAGIGRHGAKELMPQYLETIEHKLVSRAAALNEFGHLVERVNAAETRVGPTMLGGICRDYYRNKIEPNDPEHKQIPTYLLEQYASKEHNLPLN